MNKAICFLSSVIFLLFITIGCNSSDDKDISTNPGAQTETSFNFTLSSFKKQETASSALGRLASFTADQVMTGQLTATNTATLAVQTFDWSIYFDETTWEVQSNKTIILAPGTFDFALLLTKGDQQYAGSVAGQVISDGTFNVPMIIRPIIGNTITSVSLVGSLADFKFQYDATELATAGFAAPQLGVILDSGTETIFGINPATGISDNYINLAAGPHGIQLKLYDGSLQRGRSIAAQETVIVSPGLNIAMDLVALHGETTFALTEAGGNATFRFNIPAEVVNEAGGLSNLEVVFSMSGPKNPVEENALNLTQVSSDYESQITLLNKQFDNVTISLTFNDISKSPKEQLGLCTQATILNTTERTISCDLTLRRRAIIGGSLLATLGINVLNEAGEPVAGAVITDVNNDTVLGITGSGTFGTAGYLKVYLNTGNYTIKAEGTEKYGESSISLSPLSIVNQDIILNQADTPSSSFLLPDTGQTTCYDAAGIMITCPAVGQLLAQDGSYSVNMPSYLDNGDGTVTDNITNLIWQKEDDNVTRTWGSAVVYCQDLDYGGNTDWRLPSFGELSTIINYSTFNPAINSTFLNTKSAGYWSESAHAQSPGSLWYVNFDEGTTGGGGYQFDTNYARCVRGEQTVFNNLTDNSDGTISDHTTNLIWQQGEGGSMDWESALSYCESLTLAENSDWRLPNIRELITLVHNVKNEWPEGWSDLTLFPGSGTNYYQTSTPYSMFPGFIWVLGGLDGNSGEANTSGPSEVRCVRGGK